MIAAEQDKVDDCHEEENHVIRYYKARIIEGRVACGRNDLLGKGRRNWFQNSL